MRLKNARYRAVGNLNLIINETEKDPVRVTENHNSRIKAALAKLSQHCFCNFVLEY